MGVIGSEIFMAVRWVMTGGHPPRATDMPTKKLTDLFVERAPAPARGRTEYFDAGFPGLALRITDSGRKTWSLFYRFHGRLRRFTIGRYPAIKPAQARREATSALERVRQGIDPAEEKKTRRDMPSPETELFEALVQDYLERHVRKNCAHATYKEAKRDLERNVSPEWRDRSVASISRRDAIKLVDDLVERGVEIQANRTLARLRALFNWAIEKERISASPVEHMKPRTKERARDRALSDDEIRWFWQACDELGWPFGSIFKLLLLTAQRRDEVGGMKWSELDLEKRRGSYPAVGPRTIANTKCTFRSWRSRCCARYSGSPAAMMSGTWCLLSLARLLCPGSEMPNGASTP
jgi:hypothetical protein